MSSKRSTDSSSDIWVVVCWCACARAVLVPAVMSMQSRGASVRVRMGCPFFWTLSFEHATLPQGASARATRGARVLDTRVRYALGFATESDARAGAQGVSSGSTPSASIA